MSELPSGWATATLGDLGRWSSGGTPSRKNPKYFGGTIPWVKTGDLNDAVLTVTPEFITESGLQDSAAKLFPPGTLLVAMYGATIGKTAVLGIPAATNQACAALLPEGPTSDLIPYVWRFLIGNINELKQAGQGGAQPNISQEILKALQIPLAPLPEQRRIVAKLDSLRARSSRARHELDAIPKLIERYKQAILAKAFSGELTKDWRTIHGSQLHHTYRASGIDGRIASELPELPDSWTWTSVDQATVVTGGLTKNSKRSEISTRVKYLRVANVYANELRLDDIAEIGCTPTELSKTRLTKGDLLIVEGNGSLDQIGRVALWDGQISDCSHQNHIIRARPLPSTEPKYGLYWLLSPIGRTAIERVASSSSGLHTLSISKVSALPIPMCSEEEQAEIVRRIDTAFAWLDAIATEHARAEHLLPKLDQAILAKAFRGELVPQDPNDEPASVLLERIKAERETQLPKRRKRGFR